MTSRLGWATFALLSACSRPATHAVGGPELSVAPSSLDFGVVWVGYPRQLSLRVHDASLVPGHATVTATGNFSVGATDFEVPAGADAIVTVTYAPTAEGTDQGTLDFGFAQVALSGQARVPPDCHATPCDDRAFDPLTGTCASRAHADGSSCHTACTSGVCAAGVCEGSFDTCDDGNACTAESCSDASGCQHSPVQCPAPSNPCLAAACDPATGCGTVAAPDGTRCADDSCYTADVHVCLAGACVDRPRVSGRCGNLWYAPDMLSRDWPAMAFDSDRGRMVLFGGFTDDPVDETWEWDGTRWAQVRTPVSASARTGGAMVYDSRRKRMVLFGGAGDDQTWEYDGTTWAQAHPAHSPPDRMGPGMTFDTDRQVVVLYGGNAYGWSGAGSSWLDTWEYDGTDWVFRSIANPTSAGPIAYDAASKQVVLYVVPNQQTLQAETWLYDGGSWAQSPTPTSPPLIGTPTLSYDSDRERIVMFGNGGTWEFDGSHWRQVTTAASPPGLYGTTTAYDSRAHQTIVFGGDGQHGRVIETWGYDGASWVDLEGLARPQGRTMAASAYDSRRQRLVVFGGSPDGSGSALGDTWEWDGARWAENLAPGAPSARLMSAAAFDSQRGVMVLFGGMHDDVVPYDGDTWEFDGASWTQRFPAHVPPARAGAAMAYDSSRQKTVLFGGNTAEFTWPTPLDDTWEWDGNDWTEAAPSSSPPARFWASMAYDEAHQRTVLFGGSADGESSPGAISLGLNDTWTWDGTQWSQASPPIQPQGTINPMMVYDSKRQRVMVYGGLFDGLSSGDLYGWDGTAWTQSSPSTPGLRLGRAAAGYDSAHDEIVVFGGSTYEYDAMPDTLIYVPPQ